jgi:hypothetical protein
MKRAPVWESLEIGDMLTMTEAPTIMPRSDWTEIALGYICYPYVR